ncbi:MAG: small multi-drug export protein [Candidatus Thermoplasmatota archaeon]
MLSEHKIWIFGSISGLIVLFSMIGIDLRLIPLSLIFYFVPGGEIFSVISAVGLGINPIFITVYIVLMDALWSLLVILNFDLAKKIKYIGAYIKKVEEKGIEAYKNRWLRSIGFIGLVFFMAIPMQGSGSITSSVIGRALGLQKLRTFLAVIIGSSSRTMFIALATYYGFRIL